MPGLLAEVSHIVAAVSDPDALLDAVATTLLPRVDWVLADRLEAPDLVHRVAAYAAGGTLRLPEGMGRPAARRSQAGSVGLLPALTAAPRRMLLVDRAHMEQLANDADPQRAVQARTALSLGSQAVLLLGLGARDPLVGVLTLGTTGEFTAAAIEEFADVALLVGTALDNARLAVAERAVAETMQVNLLPPLPAVQGLRIAARYRPAALDLAVGGDWYDAFPHDSGLTVVIGDASGHDVTAAARMAELRSLLRAYAIDRPEAPSGLLRRLERTTEALGLDATGTCIVGHLREAPEGWRLRWTNAGHLPPVLLRNGRATVLETSPELMLGVDGETSRTDHERLLAPGETLLLYTDGLVEVPGVSLDERIAQLASVVESAADVPLESFVDRVLQAFAAQPIDDVAILAVQAMERG